MKNYLCFLFALLLFTSCEDDNDNTDLPISGKFCTPIIMKDFSEIEKSLYDIADLVTVNEEGNVKTVLATINNKNNIFSELFYEYTYENNVIKNISLKWKLNPSVTITAEEETKLKDHLKNIQIRF